MHPQAFLKTFWRMELRPQIFVAMSFAPQYETRFEKVISPAIEGLSVGGQKLKPYRVDLSKTGDSILTDIVDGIAHSQLVLADVSSIGNDKITGDPYRNGNVMYEVGIALACRHPSEVLLVRDDKDTFLFDVSSIPHKHMDFTDIGRATLELQSALNERLRERQLTHDARVQLAIGGLSPVEVALVKSMAKYGPGTVWSHNEISLPMQAAYDRLLDKGVVQTVGEFKGGSSAFVATPLGHMVVEKVAKSFRVFEPDPKADAVTTTQSDAPTTPLK